MVILLRIYILVSSGKYSISQIDRMMDLCRVYKVKTFENRIMNYTHCLAEHLVTEQSPRIFSMMELFQFADKYKIHKVIRKLAENLISIFDYYYYSSRFSSQTLNSLCKQYEIGPIGNVIIMAQMTLKHVNKILMCSENTIFTIKSDIKVMQQNILECQLKECKSEA